MGNVTEIDRDREYYFRQASCNKNLTDEQRIEDMRQLYLMYLEFQKTKTPEQIERETRAWRVFNEPKLPQKYLEHLKDAQEKGWGFFGN